MPEIGWERKKEPNFVKGTVQLETSKQRAVTLIQPESHRCFPLFERGSLGAGVKRKKGGRKSQSIKDLRLSSRLGGEKQLSTQHWERKKSREREVTSTLKK